MTLTFFHFLDKVLFKLKVILLLLFFLKKIYTVFLVNFILMLEKISVTFSLSFVIKNGIINMFLRCFLKE